MEIRPIHATAVSVNQHDEVLLRQTMPDGTFSLIRIPYDRWSTITKAVVAAHKAPTTEEEAKQPAAETIKLAPDAPLSGDRVGGYAPARAVR